MDAVEEVKSRLNIEDVVGEYVQLKRSGRNFKGLSPFSSEKTPSFMVSAEKQIWHDFSSGKGGDMFSFVMEMEGLDFKGALELLARKAGVDLDQFRGKSSGDGKHKERLYEALEAAAHFYQAQLKKSNEALEYIFKKRAFSKEIVLAFRLGYAPTSGSALINYLTGKNFTDKEIQGAGLSSRAYRGGVQDMFRGRVMIPLADPQGRVIGFTARLLKDDKNAPKYINTPQTVLYDKSRHVYGLHLAKEAIRKSKFAVLVEGNLDVVASHQAGVKQVVATAGTALTEQHLKTLGRFSDDIRLSFDADNAGTSATERAIPVASKVGVNLSMIRIPSGKDPDELIKQGGVATWEEIIQQPQYALDWLMARYQAALDIASAQGKRQFSDALLPVVKQLHDSVERDHYLSKLAALLQISREALDTKIAQGKSEKTLAPKTNKFVAQASDTELASYRKTENLLLAIWLAQPELRSSERLAPQMFLEKSARELFQTLAKHQDLAGETAEEDARVQNITEYVKMVELEYEELYRGMDAQELGYEAARLSHELLEHYIKTAKKQLVAQMAGADEATTASLLEKASKLDKLRKEPSERS
jgi:DNA primase